MRRGAMVRVPDMILEGLREQQARRRPNLYELEAAARQAAKWLAGVVSESQERERRRRWAR